MAITKIRGMQLQHDYSLTEHFPFTNSSQALMPPQT